MVLLWSNKSEDLDVGTMCRYSAEQNLTIRKSDTFICCHNDVDDEETPYLVPATLLLENLCCGQKDNTIIQVWSLVILKEERNFNT